MRIIKKSLIAVGFVSLIVIISCSIRDYSNPLLTEQFNGPRIYLQSPTNGDTISGSVDVIGYATDISQVSRIEIQTENGVITVQNPASSQTLAFNVNVPFYSMGTKSLTIRAYDRFNIATTLQLSIYVDIVSPFLYVASPPDYFYYTNTVSMFFAGTSSISQGFISQITLERMNDASFFTVSGINNWSATAGLLPNTTNDLRVTASSDRGVDREIYFKVVRDNIAPNVIFTSPSDGADVPRDLLLELYSSDSLSPIRGTIYRVDNGNYRTNGFSQYTTDEFLGLTNGPHILYAQTRDMAGNDSPLRSITVNVDDTIPSIRIMVPWYITNQSVVKMYGRSTVGVGYSLNNIAISVNGGPYNTVNMFNNSSDFTFWTNSLTSLSPNQDNTVTVRAISSMNKTNFTTRHFYVDTNPPVFNILTPANGSIEPNRDYFDYMIDVSDAETGIAFISVNVIVGGITNMTNTQIINWYPTSYYDAGSSDPVKGGAVVTNIITVYDQAFNAAVRTNVVELYPAIFVGPNPIGSTNNHGFVHQPLANIEHAVNRARSLGVTNVAILMGNYTPGFGLNNTGSGLNLSGNNIHIYGGWDPATGNQTGKTVLNGLGFLEHIIRIQNADNIDLNRLNILEGNSGTVPENQGGGLYLNNVINSRFTELVISNNDAGNANSKGAGVYANQANNNYFQALVAYNSSAEEGGGIYWSGNNNKLEMINYNNSALFSGGGIALLGTDNVLSGSIAYNSCARNGGGIIFINTRNTLVDAVINYNISSNGGGIYISNGDSDHLLSSTVFNNNQATNGGAVYLKSGRDFTLDALIHHNQAYIGGGLYLDNVMNIAVNGKFAFNTSSKSGGALYSFRGMNLNLYSTIISNQSLNGGGLYLENVNSFTLNPVADIRYNYAYGTAGDGKGGGIGILKGQSIVLRGAIHDNLGNLGAGLYLSGADDVMIYSLIDRNTASSLGGGAHVLMSTNVYFYGNVLKNRAQNGAGMYVSGRSIIVYSTVNSNTNTINNSKGGGILGQNLRNSAFHGSIKHNWAGMYGAGLCLISSEGITIDSAVYSNGNSFTTGGGGIYMEGVSNTTVNSRICGNFVQGTGIAGGGGIMISTNSYNILLQGYYSNNFATGMGGGGILIVGSDQVDIQADIFANISQSSAGGILISSSTNVSISSKIINNVSQNHGSALFVSDCDYISVDSSIISNNQCISDYSSISFGPLLNNHVSIVNNSISGFDPIQGVLIREIGVDMIGHSIQNNVFITNFTLNIYAETASYIHRTNVYQLNMATNLHDASVFGGNLVP